MSVPLGAVEEGSQVNKFEHVSSDNHYISLAGEGDSPHVWNLGDRGGVGPMSGIWGGR